LAEAFRYRSGRGGVPVERRTGWATVNHLKTGYTDTAVL
jgi:hypothetical protein